VAINLVKRRSRRLTRQYGPSASSVGESALPLGVQEIWKLVSTLPKRQREVVVLRYIGDLTEIQIANILGVARGTISQTLRAAHTKLGELLTENEQQRVEQ
jgi:DNA-directed RNA polymerase specialized sigma24 family protein